MCKTATRVAGYFLSVFHFAIGSSSLSCEKNSHSRTYKKHGGGNLRNITLILNSTYNGHGFQASRPSFSENDQKGSENAKQSEITRRFRIVRKNEKFLIRKNHDFYFIPLFIFLLFLNRCFVFQNLNLFFS